MIGFEATSLSFTTTYSTHLFVARLSIVHCTPEAVLRRLIRSPSIPTKPSVSSTCWVSPASNRMVLFGVLLSSSYQELNP